MTEDNDKYYKLAELEKIVDDSKYYLRSNNDQVKKLVVASSNLLNDLKKHELNKEERLKVSKISSWLKKIRFERLLK